MNLLSTYAFGIKNKNGAKYFILLFFCLLIIGHHLFSYLGHFGYDDMDYAKLAHDLSLGEFDPQNHFSYRLTLLGLTSLSYRFFGINDFASAVPSMLVFIGTLILVFIVLKKEKPTVIFICLTFFSLNLWGLFYSDKLMPDSFVSFFVFLNIFIIYFYKFRKRILPTFIYAFAAAIAIFLGFITKGNIILVLPLFAYLSIVDIVLKRDLKFWAQFIGISIFLLFGYLVYYHLTFGNALVRFQSIIQNGYLNLCSYSEQPFIVTLKRIGYQLLVLFISHALITGFLFVFAKPKQLLSKKILLFSTETGFFVTSAVLLLLSSNFMSISLSGYSPMCLDPRHYLFIVPVAGIAATFFIKEDIRNLNFILRSALLAAISFFVAFITKNNAAWLLYFPLLIALLLFLLVRKKHFNYFVFSVLLFVTLSINIVQMALYAQKVDFGKQSEIFKETVLSLDPPAIVLTNPVQKNLAHYLSHFSESEIRIESYSDFDYGELSGETSIYLFKNYYTRFLSGLNEQELPFYARVTDGFDKLFEDKAFNIQFFRIDTLKVVREILEKKNNFEGGENGWSGYQSNTENVYSGSYSSSLGKYSSTLRVMLDTLAINNSKKLIVSSNFKLLLMEESDVCFVVSANSGLWKGINFDKQIKAYGNWIPINVSEIINVEDLMPNDTLSFYLFNNNESEVYLDDLVVNLSALD